MSRHNTFRMQGAKHVSCLVHKGHPQVCVPHACIPQHCLIGCRRADQVKMTAGLCCRTCFRNSGSKLCVAVMLCLSMASCWIVPFTTSTLQASVRRGSGLVVHLQCMQTSVAVMFACVPACKQPTTAVTVLHQGAVVSVLQTCVWHCAHTRHPHRLQPNMLSVESSAASPLRFCKRHKSALGTLRPGPNLFPFCCMA